MIVYPFNLNQEKLVLLKTLYASFEDGKGNMSQLEALEEILSSLKKLTKEKG